MEDTNLAGLIEELRALKIRETEIVAELRRANDARTGTNIQRDTPAAVVANSNEHKRGDRVRITNKVRKPASAGQTWTEAKERLATVTSVNETQVFILTDNGTRTWRGPNNLRTLHKQP
jgi:hypothetical protein